MLTDSQVRNAKYNSAMARTRLPDVHGLYLEVTKKGRKFWKVRTWKNGRERITAVGEYPFMSLSEARAEALRIKSAVKFDKPVVEPKARTFRELAEEWLDKKIRGVRVQTHLESIEQRLAKHVYPYIAESAIDKLTLLVMLDILRHIERAWKIE